MCTRVFWNDNPIAKVTSRCMDWEVSDEPELWFYPRGLERSGGPQPDAARWRSLYSSVGLSMWNIGTSDGMNEKGLAAHALFLDDIKPPTGTDAPTIVIAMWVQYVLDHFATVAEVLEHLDDDGELVVHHGAEHTVMANSPGYDEQLANLARYAPFGGDLTPPGDITSLDRFVRASYFRHYLPEPANVTETVAGVFRITQNAAVPPGAPYNDGGVYPTWWHAASDVTNRVYYFWSTHSPSAIWVDLAQLADGGELLALDPRKEGLIGDVTAQLAGADLAY